MKRILLISALFLSSQAQAFSGSLGVSASDNQNQGKVRQSIGLTMSQPLFMGLAWWSWSGLGQTLEKDKEASQWVQTIQGLDWSFSKFKVGATAKFQAENDFEEKSAEYGVRFSVKLW
jgi:hypothetical protein